MTKKVGVIVAGGVIGGLVALLTVPIMRLICAGSVVALYVLWMGVVRLGFGKFGGVKEVVFFALSGVVLANLGMWVGLVVMSLALWFP